MYQSSNYKQQHPWPSSSLISMGFKFLNLQTIIHGCLGHNNTNHFPTATTTAKGVVVMMIKVIKSDGMINIYHQPIKASEIMLEFPNHLVCDSHSFFIGQKIPTLSPNDQLQLGHNYFLLPTNFFQSVLSFASIASSFATCNNKNTSVTATNVQAFDIKKTPSGLLQVHISDAFISKLMQQRKMKIITEEHHYDDENAINNNSICSTPQLLKEYTQLVSYRQYWKPKLETIKESKRKKLSSPLLFGIKRRRKKPHHHQSKATTLQQKNHKLKQSDRDSHHQKITTKIKSKPKSLR